MTIAADTELWRIESATSGLWDRLAAWWHQSRGERVLTLVAALWGLNALDLACTLFADAHLLLGVYGEANPVAAAVLDIGPRAIIAYKLLLVVLGTGVLTALRRCRLAELAALAMTLAYGFVVFRWKLYFELAEVQEILTRLTQGGDAPRSFLTFAF